MGKSASNRHVPNQLRYKLFIEQAPSAIAMFDKEMHYLATSRKWLEDYGLDDQDIIGKSHYEIFPEIGEDWKEIHRECLQGSINREDEARFERSDGSVQWITWDVRPWYDEDGEISGLLMYTEDRTAQKQQELALQLNKEKFEAAFKYSGIGMALVGLDGSWLQVNQRLSNMVGYDEEELHQLTFQDITHPDDLDKDLALLKELIARNRDTYEMEKRYFHKEGHVVWAQLTVSLIRDENNKPSYFISQVNDITNQKRLEKKLLDTIDVVKDQNNRLINFTHIVSHNLRSHAGNFSMLLNLLKDEKNPGEQKLIIDNIQKASGQLTETVKNLNEVISLQLNLNEQKTTINLKEAVEATTSVIQGDIERTQATINILIPNDLTVEYVPSYLDSILLNFLTNALKYRHPDRKPVITLKTFQKDQRLVLQISDNGLGIDLERYGDKLFGMYQTFHENKEAKGVGLFITKNQVEAMGGKIEVESEVGKGTTFTIQIEE